MNVYGSVLGGGGKSFDFSTSEVDTGQKWIDGKKIYCRVYTGTTSSSAFDISLGSFSYTVISFNGMIGWQVGSSDSGMLAIGCAGVSDSDGSVVADYSTQVFTWNNAIHIAYGSACKGKPYRLQVYYTK